MVEGRIMQAEAIVQDFVQGMVDRADHAGIPVTKRQDQIEFGKPQSRLGYKIALPLIDLDTPWVHINHLHENKCLLWRDVIYNGLVRKLKKSLQFVPSGCQECYKVVVRPETYEDMLKLEEAMTEKGWPSKIGIERRPFVGALYGAYFYNRGLGAGKKRFAEVWEMLKDPKIEPRVRPDAHLYGPEYANQDNVYLKRGCTEMEMEQGPSDKWRLSIFQTQVEPLIEKLIYTPEQPDQTEDEKAAIRKKWAQFAWKWDRSYSGPGFQKGCVRY